MTDALNIDALVAQNPSAKRDVEALREAQKIIEALRNSGVEDKGYDLARPYGSKKLTPMAGRAL